MASSLVNRFCSAVRRLEGTIAYILQGRLPPPPEYHYALAFNENLEIVPQKPAFSLRDLLGDDGFLWAVPKSRRSIEKRWKRKYGHEKYHLKILKPKTTIRACNTCGDDHEVGVMCPTCYKKVIEETKLMQAKIQETLQLSPVENEIVVLYENEKNEKPAEFWNGKRIVEMEKPRPSWFSKNLTQQSTQQPATTKDIKPGKQLA